LIAESLYLLGALAIGLLIPYLGGFIPVNDTSVEVYQVMAQFTAVEDIPSAPVTPQETPFDWMMLLWFAYILGAGVVFSRFAYGLYRIYKLYAAAEKTPKTKYTLVESDNYHLPFSFFHYIFISKQLPLNEEVEQILKHEELHANQWHSIDIVFTELLRYRIYRITTSVFLVQSDIDILQECTKTITRIPCGRICHTRS